MPNVYDGNTFSEVYKDDYAESDGYHRVLFNSGRALQARELTQLQTILQQQITTFGENIFQDGASVNSKSSGLTGSSVSYIKITRPVMDDVQDLVGTEYRRINGPTELQFQITHVVENPSDGPDGNVDFIRVYGRYTQEFVPNNGAASPGADVQETTETFSAGDEIADVFGINNPTLDYQPNLIVSRDAVQGSDGTPLPGGPATGLGFVINTNSSKFFTGGYFVYAPPQSIVGAEFDPSPDLNVGFEIIQDIITVQDTDALYDNQGVRPNLSSPGADRYRIQLKLTVEENVPKTSEEIPINFVGFGKVRGGVVVQIKEGNENYNGIEKRMAIRHHDTHGDFIVNPFLIKYAEGEDSVNPGEHGIDRFLEDNLEMTIPGTVNSLNPTAFVNGFRLEHEVDQTISVPKPLSSTVKNNRETSVDYNNYVKVANDAQTTDPEIASFTFPSEEDMNTQRMLSLVDGDDNDTPIGSARVKTIKLQGSNTSDGYRVHLYDINMDPTKNFRNVTKVHQLDPSATSKDDIDNDHYFEPVLEDDQLFINDGLTNSNLFPIEGGRVKSLTNVSFTVQRYFVNSSGNTSFSINTGAVNQKFDEVGDWIVIDTKGGAAGQSEVLQYIADWNATGDNTPSATINVSKPGAQGPFHVYALVEKTSSTNITDTGMNYVLKTYTEKTHTANYQGAATDDWRVEDTTSPDDLLYDGVRLISATLPDGRDVTDLLNFFGGQTDNFYGPVTLQRSGYNGTDDITVKVGYFEWENVEQAAADYICANSYVDRIRSDVDHPDYDSDEYPLFLYSDIPSYTMTSTGTVCPLENYFDFRSRLDPRAIETPMPRFHLPQDDRTISYTAEFYNQRFDKVHLGYTQETLQPDFRIYSGEESLEPVIPDPKSQFPEMELFTILYNGNTKSTDDLVVQMHKHKGYKMKDIERVEDRLGRLEETVSLSFLEQNAATLVEVNSDNEIRSKTGFFVDDFTRGLAYTSSFLQSQYIDDARFATQTLDLDNAVIMPKVNYESVTMLHDDVDRLANDVFDPSANIKTVADTIYLDYVEMVDPSMSQQMISWFSDNRSSEEHGWYNVNPYNVFTGEGSVQLSPGSDYWVDQRRLPDNIIDGGTIETILNPTLVPKVTTSTYTTVSTGPLIGNPNIEWASQTTTTTRTTVTRTQKVKTRVLVDEVVFQDLGDKTVAVYASPFMRSRRIYGICEGLRPNTRYWGFFDGVPISQWMHQLTQTQYEDALADKMHLKITVPDVDVSATEHPLGATALITDYRGDMWFDFLIPNTAKPPTPNSNSMNTVEDWNQWIAKQKQFAKQFGGSKDPQVYNKVGWKFRTGSVPFKLLDISVNNEKNCLSKARTTYTALGDINIKERDILSTRVIVKENYLGEETIKRNSTSTTTVRWFDPLAQTFLIDAERGLPGVFVTKVDVYIRRAPTEKQPQIPLQLQVRAVNNGYPVSGAISTQHRKYMSAEDVRDAISGHVNIPEDNENKLQEVLNNPVTFEFDEPFYLDAGTEYAIALLAECDNYEAYVATTYGLLLGKTSERVSKQPALGSLFLSQNGSTWTPKQNQDLAFQIHTAKFKQQGNATFYNQPYGKWKHNNAQTIYVEDTDKSIMRVIHPNHGLGVGDKPQLEGLDPGATYLGLQGIEIIKDSLRIIHADVAGYTVQLESSFLESGSFGSDDLYSNHAMNFNEATVNFMNVAVPNTEVNMKTSYISGISHNMIEETDALDSRFDVINPPSQVTNGLTTLFPSPRYLASEYMEDSADINASIQIQTNLKSTQRSKFGVVTDTDRNNYNNGYVSDVSPFIDTQRCSVSVTDFVIDNQPRDGADDTLLTNTPDGYTPETHRTLGTSPSKHITGPVILEEPANGIKVLLDMYKPQNASFDVYYRTQPSSDADIYEKDWIYVQSENSPPNSPLARGDFRVFNEYTYLIGGVDGDLNDFSQFQLKIVFRTTNSSEIPVLESIRAIALI